MTNLSMNENPYGVRWCGYCQKWKPTEGGTWGSAFSGFQRWYCGDCRKKFNEDVE